MGKEARIIFRKLTPADAESAAELDFKSFSKEDSWASEDFFNAAMDEHEEFLVAELDGKIIACAGAEIFPDGAEIESIAVDPDFRRQGIGRRLLAEMIEAILKRGVNLVILEVRPSNKAAIKLYEKFGFEIVERLKNYYPNEDAWVMAREFY